MNISTKIAVVGAGHAGVEASLAVSRLGLSCYLITMDSSSIARMSCNPAIGGLAKSHLVREIDALGGIMGYAADATSLQFKTLNRSKGRAVWSPRAQVDKIKYSKFVSDKIIKDKNIIKIYDEVVHIVVDKSRVVGCKLKSGKDLKVSSIIVAGGTFLNGIIHLGNEKYNAGRFAEPPSNNLTSSFINYGIQTSRLKTGTPPRIFSSSVDWDKLETCPGDTNINYFSIKTRSNFKSPNIPCFLAHTNNDTHAVLLNNLHKSPMYTGKINAVGPRYCPSVEDKVVRFSDRSSHQLFLEPEWQDSKQIYVNGFSTSLPAETQKEALRTIPALRRCSLIRPGYAIEYDYFPSRQLKSTMESKIISGLYFAGQLNGTSGYEEAAAQGLMAGINSALSILKAPPLILKRHESYIGVLIDDLITKDINEPYRMFTSRSEHRLFLRQDNADLRLSDMAINLGLLTKKHKYIYKNFKRDFLLLEKQYKNTLLFLYNKRLSAWRHIKRPGASVSDDFVPVVSSRRVQFAVETKSIYEGYINIQSKRVKKLQKLEDLKIPLNFNYKDIKNLSSESLEKLQIVKPETLAQASRIDGVRQSDIASLSFVLFGSK